MDNLISNAFAQLVGCSKTMFGTVKGLVATVINMRGSKNKNADVKIASPFGFGSFPAQGKLAVVVPIFGSNKSYAIVGFVQGLPDDIIPHTSVEGESWQFSNNYVLFCQNDGLKAYRAGDDTYNPTLPNGEYVGKILTDLINDRNSTLVDYINNQIAAKYDLHTHAGVQSGSDVSDVPSNSITPITANATLTSDASDISDGKYLINDSGVMP